jgi:hypothetical protein
LLLAWNEAHKLFVEPQLSERPTNHIALQPPPDKPDQRRKIPEVIEGL